MRAGFTTDGRLINSYLTSVLTWQVIVPNGPIYSQDLAGVRREWKPAPIRAATETANGAIGTSMPITIPVETFEANTNLHYPTNGNPVLLPDAAAKTAFDACFGR